MTKMLPSWLDKTFLETAFKAEVRNFDARPMGGTGDGYTSSLYRVKVELNSGENHSVIVKRMIEEGNAGNCMKESTMFSRETEMYEVTIPKLADMLEKALPGQINPLTPRYIYSSGSVLVLEDLGASGFKMLNKQQGLDLDHSLLVVRELARFHAASVILNRRDPDSMKSYGHSIFTEATVQRNMKYFSTCMTSMLADELETWPEFGKEYANKIRGMSEKMVEMIAWGARREEGRFNVLTHDDVWINNVMFRDCEEMRLIDFQFPHFASPGNELQVFFCTSLAENVWENCIDTLLEAYHTTLCETLIALGYSEDLITLEDMKNEYARSSLYGMGITIATLPAVLSSPDYDVPIFDAEITPPHPDIYKDSRFRDVIRKMLPVFEKQGAFELAEKFQRLNSDIQEKNT